MSGSPANDAPRRRGAVGVIVREGALLVIRRSQRVVAPGAFLLSGRGDRTGRDRAAGAGSRAAGRVAGYGPPATAESGGA